MKYIPGSIVDIIVYHNSLFDYLFAAQLAGPKAGCSEPVSPVS